MVYLTGVNGFFNERCDFLIWLCTKKAVAIRSFFVGDGWFALGNWFTPQEKNFFFDFFMCLEWKGCWLRYVLDLVGQSIACRLWYPLLGCICVFAFVRASMIWTNLCFYEMNKFWTFFTLSSTGLNLTVLRTIKLR